MADGMLYNQHENMGLIVDNEYTLYIVITYLQNYRKLEDNLVCPAPILYTDSVYSKRIWLDAIVKCFYRRCIMLERFHHATHNCSECV